MSCSHEVATWWTYGENSIAAGQGIVFAHPATRDGRFGNAGRALPTPALGPASRAVEDLGSARWRSLRTRAAKGPLMPMSERPESVLSCQWTTVPRGSQPDHRPQRGSTGFFAGARVRVN